jgi:hypothetical protein
VRHHSIGAWGLKWWCSPGRRSPRWRFGTKLMMMAMLRQLKLDKRTLHHGGAARGSFLRAEVVTRGGIEGGSSTASLHRNRGEKGREKGSGVILGAPCREEEERGEQGPVHVAHKVGEGVSVGP